MKKLYMVALGARFNRDQVIKSLVDQKVGGPWFYSTPGTFCIYSGFNALDIYNKIHVPPFLDEYVIVTEMPTWNASGWMPKAHCDLVAANSVVHDYQLSFSGFWTEGREAYLPLVSGIYCVYACVKNSNNTLTVRRLLYIGKADNIQRRHRDHEGKAKWIEKLNRTELELLCYSYAPLQVKSLSVCEAALIFHHKPSCNESAIEGFSHSTTHVKTSGKNLFLDPDFMVYRSNS